MEKEDILNRWSQYITDLYHDDRGPPPIITYDEGRQILKEEVQRALKKIKKKRHGRRPDDIPSEMLIAVGELGIKEITTFLNIIPDIGEIPTDLKKKSVYIAIETKPGTVECDEPPHKS